MTLGMISPTGTKPAPQENHLNFAITLMEHLVVPTFVLDADCRVVIWNRACERLTGLPASQVIGTREHWRAFYDSPRPCLADLVASADYTRIEHLYSLHEDPSQPSFGVHAENWCVMPQLGQRLYLAVDAGPVYDESGRLIAVVETLRDITEKHLAQNKIAEQAGILKAHYDEHQREADLARRILAHQIRTDLMAETGIRHSVTPATQFSGDMILAARSPRGKLYATLADATGHGLAAAVSVLPMVQEFYRLVELDHPLISMVESINFMLVNSLPLGRFVAASFICIDETTQRGEIWVGGMPDALLLDVSGEVLQRFTSTNLPLGVSAASETLSIPETFDCASTAHLVLVSDGVIEASSPGGTLFNEISLLSALAQAPSSDAMIASIHQALDAHLHGGAAHDDMSVLIIDCPSRQRAQH